MMLTADDLTFAATHAQRWFEANTYLATEDDAESFVRYVLDQTEAHGALLDLSLRSLYNVWVELPFDA